MWYAGPPVRLWEGGRQGNFIPCRGMTLRDTQDTRGRGIPRRGDRGGAYADAQTLGGVWGGCGGPGGGQKTPKNDHFWGSPRGGRVTISTPTSRFWTPEKSAKMCIFRLYFGGCFSPAPYDTNYFTFIFGTLGGIFSKTAKKGLHGAIFPPFLHYRSYILF